MDAREITNEISNPLAPLVYRHSKIGRPLGTCAPKTRPMEHVQINILEVSLSLIPVTLKELHELLC